MQELVASGQLKAQARLLVTGHSLGGALAVLAAFDIKQAMASLRMEMYTYGTPYPGNRAFAHEFNELLPEAWHCIHDGVRWLCSTGDSCCDPAHCCVQLGAWRLNPTCRPDFRVQLYSNTGMAVEEAAAGLPSSNHECWLCNCKLKWLSNCKQALY